MITAVITVESVMPKMMRMKNSTTKKVGGNVFTLSI